MEFTAPAATPAPQQHFVIFPEVVQDDLDQVEVETGTNHALIRALVVGTGITLIAAWHSKPGRSLRNRVANAIKAD
jgi:hypothetical protein